MVTLTIKYILIPEIGKVNFHSIYCYNYDYFVEIESSRLKYGCVKIYLIDGRLCGVTLRITLIKLIS